MKMLLRFLFLFFIFKADGQAAETKSYTASSDSLLNIYQAGLGIDLPLYNGRQFYGYNSFTKDSPFYPDEINWNVGSVLYENMWYRNVSIMYDIYKDEIVIRHPNGISYILFKDRVQEFSVQDKTFIRIYGDKKNRISMDGFYQRLSAGKITLFAKRIKIVEEEKFNLEIDRKLISQNQFYIFKDGFYTVISKGKSLLDLLKEKSSELKQYIKKSKIKYKANPERYITLVVEFYNKLYR